MTLITLQRRLPVCWYRWLSLTSQLKLLNCRVISQSFLLPSTLDSPPYGPLLPPLQLQDIWWACGREMLTVRYRVCSYRSLDRIPLPVKLWKLQRPPLTSPYNLVSLTHASLPRMLILLLLPSLILLLLLRPCTTSTSSERKRAVEIEDFVTQINFHKEFGA